jgi:hypothetical protein
MSIDIHLYLYIAGFAIMALSAMAQNKDLKIKIVPVGM